MFTDEHPILGHRLESLLAQVDRERDGVLLYASRYRYLKIIRIEVVHMNNRTLRLVKGAPMVDDLLSTLQIKGNQARRMMDPLMRRNMCTYQQLVRRPSPIGYGICRPRRGSGVAATPEGEPSPISSTPGPLKGIPSF